jgi:hypothetical protein
VILLPERQKHAGLPGSGQELGFLQAKPPYSRPFPLRRKAAHVSTSERNRETQPGSLTCERRIRLSRLFPLPPRAGSGKRGRDAGHSDLP